MIECSDTFSPLGIWDCQSSQAVIEFVRRGIAAKQDLHRICENMMDNCLASNSETGGVGCDNMTMVIVGLLHGKTKEEWYDMIAERVAKGDGPCAPPEYGKFHDCENRLVNVYLTGLQPGSVVRVSAANSTIARMNSTLLLTPILQNSVAREESFFSAMEPKF